MINVRRNVLVAMLVMTGVTSASGCVYYRAVPVAVDEGSAYLATDLTSSPLTEQTGERVYLDSGRLFGALTGAAFGALLGSTIGSGSGQSAAIATGAGIGAFLGAGGAEALSPQDHQFIVTARHRALSAPLHRRVRWRNRHSGYYGVIIPIKHFRTKRGYRCRQFREVITFKHKRRGRKRLVSACRNRHSPVWYEVSVRGRL